MRNSLINSFSCTLIKSHICDYDANNKQLFHLTLIYKNCLRIYINDVLVPKKNSYLVSPYKETQSIKVKLIGVLKNQTCFINVKSNSIEVNIPSFKRGKTSSFFDSKYILTYKRFNFSPIAYKKKSVLHRELKKINITRLSSTSKLDTKLHHPNYKLTNIINQYE
jgi:hypothetical protein